MRTTPRRRGDRLGGQTPEGLPPKRCHGCGREGEWPGQPCPICREEGVIVDRFDLPARAAALRIHIASLEDDYQTGRRRLDELVEAVSAAQRRHDTALEIHERLDVKIAEARDELEGIERLMPAAAKPAPVPAAAPTVDKNEGQIRAAILRFESFTVAEIAAYLHVPRKKAQEYLDAEVAKGIVAATGRKAAGSEVYEYVPPTEPGKAFEVQQETRQSQPDAVVGYEVAGGVADGLLAQLPKEVRRIARAAVKDSGWLIGQTGSGHLQLTRDDEVITVAKTPQSASEEAKALRRRLSKASQRRVQRGSPVPGTGRAMGSSGKPGRDRALARAGKTVKRQGER